MGGVGGHGPGESRGAATEAAALEEPGSADRTAAGRVTATTARETEATEEASQTDWLRYGAEAAAAAAEAETTEEADWEARAVTGGPGRRKGNGNGGKSLGTGGNGGSGGRVTRNGGSGNGS